MFLNAVSDGCPEVSFIPFDAVMPVSFPRCKLAFFPVYNNDLLRQALIVHVDQTNKGCRDGSKGKH
jgi:hypothetical protein